MILEKYAYYKERAERCKEVLIFSGEDILELMNEIERLKKLIDNEREI